MGVGAHQQYGSAVLKESLPPVVSTTCRATLVSPIRTKGERPLVLRKEGVTSGYATA